MPDYERLTINRLRLTCALALNTGEAVGGSIVVRPDLKPTTHGPVIYLNAFGTLSGVISKVEVAGGKVIVPFMDLGKFGFSAIIIDSEGNKIGFLSNEK